MKTSRFMEEQIFEIQREQEAPERFALEPGLSLEVHNRGLAVCRCPNGWP